MKHTENKQKEHNNIAIDNVFNQAVEEVLHSIKPLLNSSDKFKKFGIIDRLIVPDRIFKFKVTWLGDDGLVNINTGFRVQFNNALGPYKGGLRFHPSVDEGILKFLGFEQIFKNALTGLPIGGGKGGSDFDPKGKSEFEIMKFCAAFMSELHKFIGPRIDIPAGDIGVGSRETGYLFGAYKKITSKYDGVLTGKPFMFGGSQMRPEATGYGVIYFTRKMLELLEQDDLKGKICTVSGSGNVALHVIEKLYQVGAIPVTCSDSRGTIYDANGINIEFLKYLKLKQRGSLKEYLKAFPSSTYTLVEDYPKDGHQAWQIPCYAAFPCATQNELTIQDAKALIKNNCVSVSEGANMPSTPQAINEFITNKICFAPAKAANAGGVAVSNFEMSQNASMSKWSSEEIDRRLQQTMNDICTTVCETAREYGAKGDYVLGANIAGFKRVADAMIAEGI